MCSDLQAATKITTIIVDIDNTILNNDRRKQEILRQRLNKEVTLATIRTDYNLDRILVDEKERREFWQIFFSDEFLKFDEPIDNAARVLTELVKNHHLIYLTGRHDDQRTGDSMKEGTLGSLKKFGFPLDGYVDIYFKDKRDTPDVEFKREKIQSLLDQRQLDVGIGDTPDDVALYRTFKIIPIALRTSYFEKESQFQINGVKPLLLNNWTEIQEAIQLMNPGLPNKVVQQFADEYKGFPSNLDNIASYVLIADTFALSFVLSRFTSSTDFTSHILLFLSFLALTLSAFFGIFAILPRSVMPPDVGKPIMLIRLKALILRKEDDTPQAKARRMNNMTAAEKNEMFLKHILDAYHTLDPTSGLVERIFDLRSMTYQKVKWINVSASALLVGFVLILVIALL